MSFLLETTLGTDISQYIYQFTKPKKISSYQDILCLKGNRNSQGFLLDSPARGGIISQFLTGSNKDFNYQTIAYSNPNLFTKNIGYRGYSLLLGCIDLKFYPDVKGSLNMLLVFDQFPLTPIEIIVKDSKGDIVNCYPLKDNLVLSGVLSNPITFNYDIVEKKKLNTLELENWKRLIVNSIEFTNTYLAKHLDNKISISHNIFNMYEDEDRDNHFDGWSDTFLNEV